DDARVGPDEPEYRTFRRRPFFQPDRHQCHSGADADIQRRQFAVGIDDDQFSAGLRLRPGAAYRRGHRTMVAASADRGLYPDVAALCAGGLCIAAHRTETPRVSRDERAWLAIFYPAPDLDGPTRYLAFYSD